MLYFYMEAIDILQILPPEWLLEVHGPGVNYCFWSVRATYIKYNLFMLEDGHLCIVVGCISRSPGLKHLYL